GSIMSCVFGGGEDGGQVVAGVASLALGEVTIVEIQVSSEGAIVEGGPVGFGPGAAKQGAGPGTARFRCLGCDQTYRCTIHRTNSAAECVENADFELFARSVGEFFIRRRHRERRQPLDRSHTPILRGWGSLWE